MTRRRSAGSWRLYATATASAVAMATGSNAAIIAADAVATLRTRPSPSQTAEATGAPSITPGGIVPLYGTINTIQPSEWISIYGSNLAETTATWNGDFPLTLGGASVTINGKPAYLSYASPTQLNLQAPDDTATGSVSVIVTTSAGSAMAGVTLNQFSPSFSVAEATDGAQFVSGIIFRSNGSGAYGGGTYDILGPTGTYLGYRTVAAKVGDVVALYAVGLGPTVPMVAAGEPYSGAAATKSTLTLFIDNVAVKPSFVGISSAGLYQINLTVPPGLGQGAVPIRAMIGGMQTQAQVWFSLELELSGGGGTYGGTTGPISSGGPIFSFSSGMPIFGGSTCGCASSGGGGDSGEARRHKKQWHPKLKFPQK